MTKADLVSSIAAKAGLTKAAAEKALDAFVESVTSSLKRGEKVSLVGFGTFEIATRAARKGRNPRTGEELHIPASKTPRFRPGKSLKEAVR